MEGVLESQSCPRRRCHPGPTRLKDPDDPDNHPDGALHEKVDTRAGNDAILAKATCKAVCLSRSVEFGACDPPPTDILYCDIIGVGASVVLKSMAATSVWLLDGPEEIEKLPIGGRKRLCGLSIGLGY